MASLFTDPCAERYLLWEIKARKPDGSYVYARIGEEGWTTENDDAKLPDTHFSRCVLQGLNVAGSLQAQDLIGGIGIPTYGVVEAFNLSGEWDGWGDYSIDELEVTCLMVGWLSDGTKVTYTEALNNPVLIGVGIDSPQVGDTIKFFIRSRLGLLERDAQPLTFGEPCPVWPGDALEYIDLGDVYDLAAGSYTIEGYFWAGDYFPPSQMLLSKDSGTQGYSMSFGSGGILQWTHREQVNPTTATAALVKNQRWTHWAIRFNSATSTREILLDATVVATTAAVTGSHVNNAATFKIGFGAFNGKQSRIAIWSTVRTDAQLRDNMYLLFAGNESGLVANLVLNDGRGRTITDRRSTPVAYTNALSLGMTWGTSSWIGESLAGKARKLVLGSVRDLELDPRDPVKLTYEAGIGTLALPLLKISPVYSNGNALAGGSIASTDLTRGLVVLTPGTAVGRLTADVDGVVPWGSAPYFNGTTSVGTATKTCPAGSMTMSILCRPELDGNNMIAMAYRSGTAAGLRALFFSAVSNLRSMFQIRNDAAVSFSAEYAPARLSEEWVVLTGVLDTTALQMRLYINGLPMSTTAVTGTFNTVLGTLYVGRRDDAAAYFRGWLDEPFLCSRALTAAEIRVLALRQLASTDVTPYNVSSAWLFNEGTGSSGANLVAGQPAMTLTSVTWGTGRRTTIDLVIWLLNAAGIGFTALDTSPAVAYLNAVPGDAGWIVEGGNYLEAANALLLGTGAKLVENGTLFEIDLFRGVTGTPIGIFTESSITLSPPIDGVPLGKTVWGLDVAHTRCWSPMDKETVATFITSQPARYAFVTEPWRYEPARSARVLDAVPGARILTLYSPLQRERDAVRLGQTLLPVYAGLQKGLSLSLDTDATGIALGAEIALLVTEADGTVRFGGQVSFRIIDFRKEDTSYGLMLRRLVAV